MAKTLGRIALRSPIREVKMEIAVRTGLAVSAEVIHAQPKEGRNEKTKELDRK